ncbi:hypothetical protein BH09BAC3_BH09BAC3_10300 [soil metagenome]
MNLIHVDSTLSEKNRRNALYHGELFVVSPNPIAQEFCEFASDLIRNEFGAATPETAQNEMTVNEFIAILKVLKPQFIHHAQSKIHVQNILRQSGCDLEKTYFDVPRLRTSTSDNYLTSGIAYAFHPHRDTWYSAPMSQINWWLPIYEIEMGNCLALHPDYWNKPIINTSEKFNYKQWIQGNRKDASDHVKEDSREQPMALTKIDMDCQLRLVVNPGGLILFSGAHLHSSVPNYSGKTRFSIDFRTIHIDDVINGSGANNVDSNCQDLTLSDFIRASDFEHLPADLITSYGPSKPTASGIYSPRLMPWA